MHNIAYCCMHNTQTPTRIAQLHIIRNTIRAVDFPFHCTLYFTAHTLHTTFCTLDTVWYKLRHVNCSSPQTMCCTCSLSLFVWFYKQTWKALYLLYSVAKLVWYFMPHSDDDKAAYFLALIWLIVFFLFFSLFDWMFVSFFNIIILVQCFILWWW